MAFANKIGSFLKQAASTKPSIYQALRFMSSSKLFIGGLSYSADDQSLREAFSGYGEIVEARVIFDRETGRSKGFGFITYTSGDEASAAVTAMDGKDLHGRMLRVNYATDRRSSMGGGSSFGDGGFGGGGGGGYNGGGYSGGGGGYGGGGGGYGGGGYSGGYGSGGRGDGGGDGDDGYGGGAGGGYGGRGAAGGYRVSGDGGGNDVTSAGAFRQNEGGTSERFGRYKSNQPRSNNRSNFGNNDDDFDDDLNDDFDEPDGFANKRR